MNLKQVERLLYGAAAVGGLYMLYRLVTAAGKAGDKLLSAPAAAGEAIGGALFDFVNPNAAGDNLYLKVHFADGTSQMVGSQTVAKDGTFMSGGVKYVIKDDASGVHYAYET